MLVLGADGVDGDQGTVQRQAFQQQRDGGDLVRLAAHRLLAEHQALTGGPSGDEMQRLAPLAAGMRPARGLAVDGDQVRLRLAQALDPAHEAGLRVRTSRA